MSQLHASMYEAVIAKSGLAAAGCSWAGLPYCATAIPATRHKAMINQNARCMFSPFTVSDGFEDLLAGRILCQREDKCKTGLVGGLRRGKTGPLDQCGSRAGDGRRSEEAVLLLGLSRVFRNAQHLDLDGALAGPVQLGQNDRLPIAKRQRAVAHG